MGNDYLLNQEDYGAARFFMFWSLLWLFIFSLGSIVAIGYGESAFVPMTLIMLVLDARFWVEWGRFRESRCAVLSEDSLSFYGTGLSSQEIPLERIRGVRSCFSLFVVRSWNPWSRGAAFVKVTLTNGSVFYTLARRAAFEFFPGKRAVEEIRMAINNKKYRLAAART